MNFSDLPFILYIVIAISLFAIVILFRGFKMPSNHSENEHVRSVIRKKIYMNQGEITENTTDNKVK